METDPREQAAEPEQGERGEHNELGYRKVDEDAGYDERGSQGTAPGEPPADEDTDGA